LDEIHAKLKELAVEYGAIYVESIGESHEGNTIPVIRFGGKDSKLTFWMQGCIHAREWISPATVMYMVEELLSSKDPAVVALIDKIEFAVAPCINPDGYKFSWTNERHGARFSGRDLHSRMPIVPNACSLEALARV
jgi:murein tripeptide amidase MpaA